MVLSFVSFRFLENTRITKDSDEDTLPKHPALGPEKKATPVIDVVALSIWVEWNIFTFFAVQEAQTTTLSTAYHPTTGNFFSPAGQLSTQGKSIMAHLKLICVCL